MTKFDYDFEGREMVLYPLGDWHLGSSQCSENFIRQVISEIKHTPNARWVGMGDMMENAIIGSKSDVYTQMLPPREQLNHIVSLLKPIEKQGLFLISGNHEQRTMRAVGIKPEEHIAVQLNLPFKEFSCLATLDFVRCKTPRTFTCYFHHNYGGGYQNGSKVNRADQLRHIVPTADAIFSGHFHITSRIPVQWYEAECGAKQVFARTGYDYITGSALTWNESYAEEKGKPPSAVEHIKVTFRGCTSGRCDNRQQIYEIISPKGREKP